MIHFVAYLSEKTKWPHERLEHLLGLKMPHDKANGEA